MTDEAHNPPATSTVEVMTTNPTLGQPCSFAATFPPGTKNPVIDVAAYDAEGTLVYAEVDSIKAGTYTINPFGGDGSPWKDNPVPVTCTVTLQDRIFKPSGEVVTTLAGPITFSASA
jgi:hypothetical protein